MGNADHDLLKKRARGGLGQGDSGVTKSKGEVNDFFRTKIVNPPTIDRRNLGQPREKVSMDPSRSSVFPQGLKPRYTPNRKSGLFSDMHIDHVCFLPSWLTIGLSMFDFSPKLVPLHHFTTARTDHSAPSPCPTGLTHAHSQGRHTHPNVWPV